MSEFQALVSDAFALTHKAKETIESWQWAEQSVDYSRVPNYDTPYLSRFTAERMPFWKQPLEDLQDRDCREVCILKCSRAGYSENLVLTDMRYNIARNPEPMMYVTGKMELAKDFFDTRVCRGMDLATETAREYRQAKVNTTSLVLNFPRMDLRVAWASSDMAKKQAGYARLYADEFSLFDGFSVDALRRRCAAYPFHHILFGSSLDFERRGNPEEDPALIVYNDSNRNEWHMTDPAGGLFVWRMGDESTKYGIKWPEECRSGDGWDLNAVRESAYYMTPGGEKVEEKHRMDLVRFKANWIPGNPKGVRRGYKIIAPMIPFADCSFGAIAARFLAARYNMKQTGSRHDRNRNTLRTFHAEFWAAPHREEEMETTEDALSQCAAEYKIGELHAPKGWTSGVFVTADIQKFHIWWLARVWAVNSETKEYRTALLDYGNSASFDDLDDAIGQFSPAMVGIDIGYALRQSEVADYCAKYTDGVNPKDSRVIALRGNDSLKNTAVSWTVRDATEGRMTGGAMSPYLEITWAPDVFRSHMMEEIQAGARWHIPKGWGGDERKRAMYNRQVTSTRKVDGEWIRAHNDDHLFDCESMQWVLARWDSII
jgi:hypothetical protein